jgi:hypothetical protein
VLFGVWALWLAPWRVAIPTFLLLVLFTFVGERVVRLKKEKELRVIGIPSRGSRSVEDVKHLLQRGRRDLAFVVLREIRPSIDSKTAKDELLNLEKEFQKERP